MSADFDKLLRATIADWQLTGSEKKAVAEWLDGQNLTEQTLGVLRSRVFSIAKEEVPEEITHAMLDWCAEVLKVIQNAATKRMAPSPVSAVGATEADEVFFAPNPACALRIVKLFDSCKQTADVCVFTITDDRLAKAILAAHNRGVKVRIITDNDKVNDLGSDIEEFIAADVPVRVDKTEFHMHHKFAIFDGKHLLNGSYNWTRGAAEKNNENFVIHRDPALIRAFQNQFDSLWKQFA